jgi:hypothetical protein
VVKRHGVGEGESEVGADFTSLVLPSLCKGKPPPVSTPLLKGSPVPFQLTLTKAHMIHLSVLPVPTASPASAPAATTKISALIKASAAASEACL